jgi:hypothetical protein
VKIPVDEKSTSADVVGSNPTGPTIIKPATSGRIVELSPSSVKRRMSEQMVKKNMGERDKIQLGASR